MRLDSTLVAVSACWSVTSAVVPGCHGAPPAPPPVTRVQSGPEVRNAHAIAYDARRRAVILFGGADARRVRGDTWVWEGTAWALASDTGPRPRTFPAMVFDEAHDQVVLFGGRRVLFGAEGETHTVLGDTWVWNGAAWRELRVSGPPARAEAAAAYDADRRRVMVFGGYSDESGARQRFADTWEWDARRWSRVAAAGPSARSGAAMAYDAARRRIVLFGGATGTPPPSGETWELDGSVWRRVPELAAGRFNSVAAYDAARGRIIRFGGWDGERRVGETWAYHDGRWTLLLTSGPSPRNHTALAYDRARRRLVLFGGHDGDNVFGDTWEWDGASWALRASQPAERRIGE